jgi:hypothetical protein
MQVDIAFSPKAKKKKKKKDGHIVTTIFFSHYGITSALTSQLARSDPLYGLLRQFHL